MGTTGAGDTRTNEEIVTRAVRAELPILPFPLPVPAMARGVVAALAAAGRLVTPEHDAQVERAERLLRESEADRSFLNARILLQRDALEASEAARANLEAVIAEARAVYDRDDDEAVDAVMDDVLSRAGDPVVLREHDAQVSREAVKRFVNEQSARYRRHSGVAVVEDYALAVELFGIDPEAEDTGWGDALRAEGLL